MQALANSYWFWLLLFAGLAVVYFLPTLIGLIRGVDQLAFVVVLNTVGGVTGVGWLGALVLAFGPKRRLPEPVWLTGPEPEYYPVPGISQPSNALSYY
jgi:hypothetical protein